MRWIALPAVLIAVIGGLFYAVSRPDWRSAIPVRLEEFGPAEEVRAANEDWLICTTMPGMAEADWAQLDPDFAAGKRALVGEDWSGAITALKLAAARDPYNADIQNYIGYAYRRLRQVGPAMQHYQRALVLNRRHRSAHAHLGELYLVLGDAAKAEQQLATLEEVCLIPCVETDDLKRAIATYRTIAMR